MGKMLVALFGILLFSVFFAQAQEYFDNGAEQDFVSVCNNNVQQVPFVGGALGGETLRVAVPGENEFGAKTAPDGKILQHDRRPYADSTVKLYISRKAIDELSQSETPAITFKRLWGTEIRYEGLNFFSSVKFLFYDLGFRLAGLFIGGQEQIRKPAGFDFENAISGGDKMISCADGNVIRLEGENTRPIKQGTNNTCTPVSLIWIFEWLNRTHPGIAVGGPNAIARNLSKVGLALTVNGTKIGSIPPAIAGYINKTGYNSSIKLFANWTLENDTWKFDSDGDGKKDMTTRSRNKSVVVGGQNVSVVPTSDYFQAVVDELAEGEGVLIIFDDHTVAVSKVDDKDLKQLEVMDPAVGDYVSAVIEGGEMTVYDKDGQPRARGPVVMIVGISPGKLK